jgi:hypothetical protein
VARLDGWVAKSQGDSIKGAANTLYPPKNTKKYTVCKVYKEPSFNVWEFTSSKVFQVF